jgi:signal transduction histidine kinase
MKKLLVLIGLMAVAGFIVTFLAFRTTPEQPNVILINDAVRSSMERETTRDAVDFLTVEMVQVFAEMDRARQNRDFILQIFMYALIGGLALMGVIIYLYSEQKLFQPFRKLQHFAKQVAGGNLDVPLEMDQANLFGAFTESFDLMREELRAAKENEHQANLSKKELVASLSHDIKTPVASIQSAMDLLMIKAVDDNDRKRITAVNAKLEQINTLITDMFHSTLEELQVLKVEPTEITSPEIATLIEQADYEQRVATIQIPNCIVVADPLRLQQVFDNIISNSYKYANTDLCLNAQIEDGQLVISIRDFGSGVPTEELSLLFNKFYRAKDASQVAGYGLGLYLAKYFMENMTGAISCENLADGFVVKVKLKLAG